MPDPSWRILPGDCIEVMATLPDRSLDAIVTDPPYGLGFMGREWDSLPPGLPWALECLRVLKPGGHLLAFGGTRTSHRLVCAIEDAGFEIRDALVWLYGSGFPKSLDVSKAIDKIGGGVGATARADLQALIDASGLSDREIAEVAGVSPALVRFWRRGERTIQFAECERIRGLIGGSVPDAAERERIAENPNGRESRSRIVNVQTGDATITAPATRDAEHWEGWGTALKPAHEPICVARKPLVGTVAGNVLAHGTGALNVDGCRIDTPDGKPAWDYPNGAGGHAFKFSKDAPNQHGPKTAPAGRWPANVVLDEAAAAMLDEQTGNVRSSGVYERGPVSAEGPACIAIDREGYTTGMYADAGGASRFLYVAKPDQAERNVGLHGQRNPHPTVKPMELMRWLCRLVTPPGGTVLDPFTGSGTTGIAALREGFSFIGIERESEYIDIARARIIGDAPLLNTHAEAA